MRGSGQSGLTPAVFSPCWRCEEDACLCESAILPLWQRAGPSH
jgi:hypothetical protein